MLYCVQVLDWIIFVYFFVNKAKKKMCWVHIWIDFDVQMFELPCEYTHVVVKDIVGNQELEILDQQITKERISVDSNTFKGVIDEEKDAEHRGLNEDIDHHHAQTKKYEHPELEADWDSTSDQFQHNDFNAVLEYHDFTMVNFYANWCSHCRNFAPTWKEAEDRTDQMEFRDKNGAVVATKLLRVNCVDFGFVHLNLFYFTLFYFILYCYCQTTPKKKELCASIGIRAYPTVRLYKHDKSFTQYTGPREVQGIVNFITDFIHNEDTGKHEVVTHHSSLQEGCRVHGELLVRRVPGYFLLEADSKLDSLDPRMTNVSHRVNHLYIVGDRDAMRDYVKNTASKVTQDILKNVQPMKRANFITSKAHTAPQHYLNVIPTRFDDKVVVYQATVQSHIADVEITSVPQARFQYIFSPLSIHINTKGRPLYDFLTSVFAIIGGTYTFISLLDKFWDSVSVRLKKNIGKLDKPIKKLLIFFWLKI
ncbi:hypothetical protein RFI_07846 [Reticulomyxa filosa]|uniref:Thioredoxin domain-containing protein n=1 Tax=Reticulomyxa filosa TaxID=46433 RepID=X6NTK5_RETFI|nr:hypothetical protein RFI_07846 [Reticulomyxa filosa]|eukprot:ETO29283.1 hypothetical protein RFI_07846 [Reticulomyxa filosa]